MRFSELPGSTLYQTPTNVTLSSQKWLLRGGYLCPVAPGLFGYLPFGQRVRAKITQRFTLELSKQGALPIEVPPAAGTATPELLGQIFPDQPFTQFQSEPFDWEMTQWLRHYQMLLYLAQKRIQSYRQLPALLYHQRLQGLSDSYLRSGLLGGAHVTICETFSLAPDESSRDRQIQNYLKMVTEFGTRLGVPLVSVQAGFPGLFAATGTKLIYLSPQGPDEMLICGKCGYAATVEVARGTKVPAPRTNPAKLEKVATPGRKTIAEICDFLKVTPAQTLKAVFYRVWCCEMSHLVPRTVMALVQGDYEVNPVKLLRLIHGVSLRPARPFEIEAVGAIPGYAGPLGLHGVLVVVDELVSCSDDLITGANEPDFHYRHVQFGRDFQVDVIGDLVQAGQADPCLNCQTPLKSVRGVEIGGGIAMETSNHLFGPVNFLNQTGQEQSIAWGWLHFNPGAFLAVLAEIHQDEQGLIWPLPLAPFQVHLVMLGGKKNETSIPALADDLVRQLQQAGIEVLFDDRFESPGVKFNDADLIGIPFRLTLAPRSLEKNCVELKARLSVEPIFILLNEIVTVLKLKIQEIEDQFNRG